MQKTRVLIVDDDVNLARLSAMVLEDSGRYEVLTEKESVRALPIARQFKPDIMLLDVDMPDKSGGEIASEAAADPALRNVPVIFLTGLITKLEAGENGTERGGMFFLAKPVMPEVLLESVGRIERGRAA